MPYRLIVWSGFGYIMCHKIQYIIPVSILAGQIFITYPIVFS